MLYQVELRPSAEPVLPEGGTRPKQQRAQKRQRVEKPGHLAVLQVAQAGVPDPWNVPDGRDA